MNKSIFPKHRILRAAHFVVWLAAVTARGGGVCADEATIVQPFVGETTILVLKVDPTRLAPPDFAQPLKVAFPGGEEAYAGWSMDVTKGIENLRAATGGQSVYATIGIPLSSSDRPVYLFVKETSAQNQKRFNDILASFGEIQSSARDGFTVITPLHHVDIEESLDAIVLSPRADLSEAFEAVNDHPIQALLLPPDYIRRTVAELMPQLPSQLGGGPSGLLTEGLIWAALGIDPAVPRAELVVQSASEQAARDLAEHLPKMLLGVYEEFPDLKSRITRDRFQDLLSLIKPQVAGDRITIRLDGKGSFSEGLRLIASAPAAVTEKMRRRSNIDSFKQILLGIHNFHDTYGQFPPHEASGDRRLSWRVHILPFVGKQELYEEFALDQPWDSAHNEPLIEKMPKIYGSQWLGLKPGHTTFLAPTGNDTILGGAKAVRFLNVLDGTSNTVILVEVKPSLSVPWTAPQDYAFDPERPGEGLHVGDDSRILAALTDGSAQSLRGNIAPELLLRLFRMSDGNPIDWKEVR